MTSADFEFICKLVRERSAVVLGPGKEYLVEARLAPIVRERKLRSIRELLACLQKPADGDLTRQIVEALVTTESSFFRDHHPFEALRRVILPELIARRRDERRLNIWCAASATGQEPFSVAMLLREHFAEMQSWKISLLASDVSRQMLERAREGRFNQIEVNRGLPASLLVKYFEQHGTSWQIKPIIRDMVTFQELNLARPWPALPRMDLILLRNVMIYFDVDTKKAILGGVARLLRPDGYLLLGGAETTFNLDDSFRRIEPANVGAYQKAARATAV